jgi:small nuclear ribonucleoprotein (snRNP)-like protein
MKGVGKVKKHKYCLGNIVNVALNNGQVITGKVVGFGRYENEYLLDLSDGRGAVLLRIE